MTLEIGTRLGHYRILALLGRGGMADVYTAEDERLGREVALKAVPPEFARDPERVERFRREVRAAARLSHPNIVTVYEFGQGDGLHFYTMALMAGGDLKARIRAHPEGMPPAEARSVAVAMARALDYAHKRGYVHRDVKPENILFGEEGTPQLTDFGIARAMSEGTRMTATGMSIGSPHYMSPEQARGLAADGRSDLYSLGVVLYEMLTGRLPFDAGDTLAVAYAHVNDPAPALPTELADWQPVVDRLLGKSPEDRYGSAGELAEVLGADALPLAPGPVTRGMTEGREAGTTRQAGRSGTRLVDSPKPRRTLLAAIGGGVLALAVVGIGYLSLRDTEETRDEQSIGGGGGGQVQPAPERSRSPSPAESPFGLERADPVEPEPVLPTPSRREPARPRPASSKQARPQRPQPKPLPVIGGGGVLVVETTPAGAEVLVDGTPVGKTPLERSDIRAGVREVSVRHPHYETVQEIGRRFRDGRVVRIQRALVRGRGALTVTATPRETWVEVEGKRLAERTPVTLEDLPAGEVQVRLGAREHRPLAVRVGIPKGGLARLERRLQPIPYGSLTLVLEPADASVILPDSRRRYQAGVRLPEGAHRVVVRADGYRDATRSVNISGDTRVRIALERRQLRAVTTRVFDGIEFVWIPSGEFRMGSTSRLAYDDEKPVTRVRISRGYWLGKYEVTQGQWESVLGENPSTFKYCGEDCPVENVSWIYVQEFIRKLNGRSGGRRYRLPTEAEWEYAARAGTTTDNYAGDITERFGKNPVVNRIAWYNENSGDRTHPVGGKAPNAFGLHDMMGNVWEWVGDWKGDYPGGTVTDPVGPASGLARVYRGGGWIGTPAGGCRAAARISSGPLHRDNNLGFRLLRTE